MKKIVTVISAGTLQRAGPPTNLFIRICLRRCKFRSYVASRCKNVVIEADKRVGSVLQVVCQPVNFLQHIG